MLEYRAISEFGWTQNEYDSADHARLSRMLAAAAIRDVLEKSDRGGEMSDDESALLGRVLKGQGSAWSGTGGLHG